jgi:VWFA-related protein
MTARALSLVLVITVVLAAGSLGAQQGDAQPPRFRASVEVTSVDVAVVDSQGKPLAGLTPSDFSVRVDSKVRRVVTAEWVPLATSSAEAKPIARIPEGYSSNENATGGRLIAIAVDEPHIRPGGAAAVVATANAFIDRLSPSDRIAVVSLAIGGAATPFVAQRERDRIKEAIVRMTGQQEQLRTTSFVVTPSEAMEIAEGNRLVADQVAARECSSFRPGTAAFIQCRQEVENTSYELADQLKRSSDTTIRAMREILQAMQTLDGPKTLILMSEGFSVRDTLLMNELGSLAASTRTSIYALKLDNQLFEIMNTRGPVINAPGLNIRNDGLEALTAAARGTLFNVTGTGSQLFAHIEAELSGYYLVGVESDPSDRDGKPHAIRIDVQRRGAIVRTRRQLLNVPSDLNRPRTPRDTVTAGLSAPLLMSALPLRVGTFSLRGPDDAKVQLLMRLDVGTDFTGPQPAAIGYVITDKGGRVVENRTLDATLSPVMAGVPSALQYVGSASLAPGDYTLKFAVVQGDRVGTVEHPVRAVLADFGEVTLSDLMVGGPLDTSNLLRPTVGHTVSFGSLHGYLEAYGPSLGQVEVRYEVAAASDSPALIESTVPTRLVGADRALFTQVISVGRLPAGDYILRAVVRSNGETLKTLTRGFEIAAPAVLMTSAAGAASTPSTSTELFLPVQEGLIARKFGRDQALQPQALDPFMERVPEPTKAAFEQGLTELRSGNYAAAEISFKRAIRPDVDSTAALTYLAATMAAAGRDNDAAGAWQTALVDGEDFPQIYEWLGESLARTRDYAGAQSILEEATGRWPSDTRFSRTLAMLYATLGRGRDAIRTLDRYIADGHAEPDLLLLAVEWIFQAHNNRSVVTSSTADLAMARNYAAKYASANGPNQALVQQWMDYLENEKR